MTLKEYFNNIGFQPTNITITRNYIINITLKKTQKKKRKKKRKNGKCKT